jgi:polysaccharide export outer membrane protein
MAAMQESVLQWFASQPPKVGVGVLPTSLRARGPSSRRWWPAATHGGMDKVKSNRHKHGTHGPSWALAVCLGIGAVTAAGAQTPPVPTPAPAAATPADPRPAEFRLGPGDSIQITVYQNPDLSLEARLSDGGLISYPLLGVLRLGGLTVGDAARLLADGLRRGDFVKNPQVSVSLLQVRGSQVSVLGQVNKPGRYPLEVADTRLSDMLAQAGGVVTASGTGASGGDLITVIGQRDGKPFRVAIDLPQVFRSADRADDIVLQAGDVVWVDRAPMFYIYGEVQRPGQLRLERGMTLLQGLAAGGGLTLRGTEKGIRIQRRGADGRIAVLEPGMAEELRSGDVIYVRESLF